MNASRIRQSSAACRTSSPWSAGASPRRRCLRPRSGHPTPRPRTPRRLRRQSIRATPRFGTPAGPSSPCSPVGAPSAVKTSVLNPSRLFRPPTRAPSSERCGEARRGAESRARVICTCWCVRQSLGRTGNKQTQHTVIIALVVSARGRRFATRASGAVLTVWTFAAGRRSTRARLSVLGAYANIGR